jgi:hypothetical protein
MSTPIYDGLIRDRDGLGPGGLTDATLKELAEHRASLALPPPMEFPAPEPEPEEESSCTCAAAGDCFAPAGHYADCPQADAADMQPVIEVKTLQEKDEEPEPEPEEPEPAEAITQVIPVVPADETQEIDQSELVVK